MIQLVLNVMRHAVTVMEVIICIAIIALRVIMNHIIIFLLMIINAKYVLCQTAKYAKVIALLTEVIVKCNALNAKMDIV